jgi:hypothetical protein
VPFAFPCPLQAALFIPVGARFTSLELGGAFCGQVAGSGGADFKGERFFVEWIAKSDCRVLDFDFDFDFA